MNQFQRARSSWRAHNEPGASRERAREPINVLGPVQRIDWRPAQPAISNERAKLIMINLHCDQKLVVGRLLSFSRSLARQRRGRSARVDKELARARLRLVLANHLDCRQLSAPDHTGRRPLRARQLSRRLGRAPQIRPGKFWRRPQRSLASVSPGDERAA